MTIWPADSAGSMTSWISCLRAAMNRYISASASMSMLPKRTISRIRSPRSVPPGSRTTTGSRATNADPRSSTCVVLPEPSGPSKVMKRPRATLRNRLLRGRRNPQAALRLFAGAAGRQLVLRDELVLKPAQVRVLGRDLDRPQGRLHRLDRRRRFSERPRGGLIAFVHSVDAGERIADLRDGVALEDVDG